jgi:hypothetical protein
MDLSSFPRRGIRGKIREVGWVFLPSNLSNLFQSEKILDTRDC